VKTPLLTTAAAASPVPTAQQAKAWLSAAAPLAVPLAAPPPLQSHITTTPRLKKLPTDALACPKTKHCPTSLSNHSGLPHQQPHAHSTATTATTVLYNKNLLRGTTLLTRTWALLLQPQMYNLTTLLSVARRILLRRIRASSSRILSRTCGLTSGNSTTLMRKGMTGAVVVQGA
jgi:hypothetical protein